MAASALALPTSPQPVAVGAFQHMSYLDLGNKNVRSHDVSSYANHGINYIDTDGGVNIRIAYLVGPHPLHHVLVYVFVR